MRQPTGRLNPGEQNWRSSYPYGEKSVTEDGAGPCLSTCATARSTSAVAASALLVRESRARPQAGQDEPMLDPRDARFVARQPGDRADRARNEQEAVRVSPRRAPGQDPRQLGGHGNRGQVVVGQRRMADMAGDKNLVGARPRHVILAVGQAPRFQRGVDHHVVFAVDELVELVLAQAKPPALLVVGRTVGNHVGPVGACEKVRPELGERHAAPGPAVL